MRLGEKNGEHYYISTRRFPTEAYLITIGIYVRIAPNTMFFTHGGLWSVRKKYNDDKLDYFGKIVIGDYSYIGEGCMIMAGVSIGSNVIIGAGSVVTKSVPDGDMVAGNPARYIGEFRSQYYTEALNYLNRFWKEIFAYLDDGELPIDNNLAERTTGS